MNRWGLPLLAVSLAVGVLALGEATLSKLDSDQAEIMTRNTLLNEIDLPTDVNTYFGAIAGGGAPSYNEIALEKNLLYFQRSLTTLGFSQQQAQLYFASGNFAEPTVRYLNDEGDEQFKAAEILDLDGGATIDNVYSWFSAIAQAEKPCPAFLYFTGHGFHNKENEDDNSLILWDETFVSVSEMAGWLDQMPADRPFVTMMAQCYSGAFANLIYEKGDPQQPVALQARCGFFATVASRPSVGCTPAVNEADYKDYSSSFFAGLTGRDRLGNPVASADFNQDNQITYTEAHAFAKVDEATSDWPVSTSEAWLQRQILAAESARILAEPMEKWEAIARPEQRHVIESLAAKIGFDPTLAYTTNQLSQISQKLPLPNSITEAYHKRLEMELINIAAEKKVRDRQNSSQIAILDKILACEASRWQ